MLSLASRLSSRVPQAALCRAASSQVALTEEIAGVPSHGVAGVPAAPAAPALSTTGSGAKVVTHEGQSGTTLTLVVGAGSRDEADASAGATHLLQHLAFKNTLSRSEIRLGRDLEDAGCRFTATATREALVYQITTLPEAGAVQTAVAALAETAMQPRFKAWDVDAPKVVAGFDFDAFEADPAAQLAEEAHAAAFHDATLGRRFFNPESAARLTADDVAAFHAATVGADRVALVVGGAAAAGVDVAAAASAAFGDAPKAGASRAAAQYKGGEQRVGAVSGAAHVALAFEGAPLGDADAPAAAVLAQIVSSANGGALCAAHHAYSDAGLFLVQGAADAAGASALVDSMAAAVKDAAAGKVDANALSGAKARVALGAAAASREARGLDLATRALALGAAPPAAATAAALAAVAPADVQRVAQRLLKGRPTIASYGAIAGVPRYDAVEGLLR